MTWTPSETPTPRDPDCAIQEEIKAGFGIGVEAVAPPQGATESKTNERIPLIVTADDMDELFQTCQCLDGESPPSSTTIWIMDTVRYSWSAAPPLGLMSRDGPATLYQPPDMEVGVTHTATVRVDIKDSRANDKPAWVNFKITLKRVEDCKYRREVSIEKEGERGRPSVATPRTARCWPLPEKWDAVPKLSGDAPPELKVCVGERVVLRASGGDSDTIKLACGSKGCGAARKDSGLVDELKYTWTAATGGFPDHGAEAVTNSTSTTAIYKAPDKPGEDTVTVLIQDSGKQARDGPVTKKIRIKVHKVDLQIEGVSEADEECEGTHLCLNRDDDDESKTIDRKQTGSVTREDDLLKITLVKEPKEGKVTLSARQGDQKIEVWTEKTKVKEVKLPATFPASELPKTLWVEGVEVSDKLRDVELRLESDEPHCLDTGKLTVLTADLDVDTDRDAAVHDEKDETKEEKHDKNRGAIFNVNFDRDGARGPAGAPLPDAIHFDDAGEPVDEDKTIENAEDVKDIGPLVVRQFGFLPPGAQVFLKVADKEDIQSIHLYKKRAAAETAIWGSLGDRVAGGPAEATEKDITPWVKLKEDVEFGVEGLFFRSTGAVNKFDGEIDLTLELRVGGKVLCQDAVRMKVAPWMMLPHTENSTEVWVAHAGAINAKFRENARADAFYVGLDNSRQLRTDSQPDAGTQWFQDHIEIGYTRRPGGPKTHSVFRLPYNRRAVQPAWPRKKLLKSDVGIFQLGIGFGVDSGDYGGNLELMPPTATHKLGRIVIGTRRSDELKTFLESQEVQAPVEVPTRWLGVGHVDEALAFTGAGKKVAVADTSDAYDLMNAIPAADRGSAVFFATGALPKSGVASADATTNKRIETGVDHRGKPWKYIRIYEDSGSGAAGQVGRIKLPLRNGYIEIDRVWNTTSNVISPGSGAAAIEDYMFSEVPPTAVWNRDPKKGDKYVLVEGTRFWFDGANADQHGTPAIVTVSEVLRDANLEKLNKTDAQGEINKMKTALEAAAGGAGNLVFVKVPVIYVGTPGAGFSAAESAVAFTPGLANVHVINGQLYFPRQFGPRDSAGLDVFEKRVRSRLSNVLFADDWDLYHRLEGEVHCGSSTKRIAPALDWWANQP